MQHKKLMYVPGLISLLGLPLLLLMMGPEEPKVYNSLRFFLPGDEPDKPGVIAFSSAVVVEKTKGKKINTVEFWYHNSNVGFDSFRHNTKLDFIVMELQKMTALRDTSNILRIELGEGFTYGEFIWLLDLLALHDVKRYALVKNSFYIFPNELIAAPDEEEPIEVISWECGLVSLVSETVSAGWWERFFTDLETLLGLWIWHIKHNYLLITGFLTLIVIPFFVRIRKYRHFVRILTSKYS